MPAIKIILPNVLLADLFAIYKFRLSKYAYYMFILKLQKNTKVLKFKSIKIPPHQKGGI
jgi:hypothetical protein